MIALLLVAFAASPSPPIPDGEAIKQRMLRRMSESEAALERYSCIVRERTHQLDSGGAVKKTDSEKKEQFFVHGIAIEHVLERDGEALDAGAARKEQARVDKEVKRFSDPEEAAKRVSHDEKQAHMFLRALELANGRREARGARSTLIYDLRGDPSFHPKKLEERFAQALAGTVAVDEETGTPIEMRFATERDVKIGGGLLANLHKGFWLHLIQQRQEDGVWILRKVEGSGDARAALLLRARFRFREELEGCHVFSVDTQQKLGKPGP